ncbi:Oxysterol-binding protein- protein 1 [Dermatophagoides farinae]|uniref:Oxysterol-binding protein- protein 1 n=1 Tax=Dermatophagoides farinae TaxID=6954 RepID=A0A922IAA4_DERFA|nr:Oxysterol-binding protein- protein 1 [Dermatophagoides farinae]
MFSSYQPNNNNKQNEQQDDKESTISNADLHDDQKTEQKIQPLKLDAQEFYDIHEDDLVDFETSEEFLLHFSRIGQVQLVKKLLSLRNAHEIALNIDCKGTVKANFGWSPLHLATYFGHYEVVEILLKNGADVNIQNEEGDTPLHKAAYTGRENIVILLLAHQANVFISNGDSLRAFELAKTDSIQKLLSAAEKFDIKRREERYLSAARSGQISVIKELLEDTNNGININCTDSSGNTALHCAAYRGQTEVVIFLLKNGIDTAIKNKRGQLASNVAATISLKQLIQEAHLSVMTPRVVASLKNKSVARFEGCLLRKARFFGWRPVWVILERGVFSYFQNRADAATGVRRKGYKYLDNAITEVVHDNVGNNNSNSPSISSSISSNLDHKHQQQSPSPQPLCFIIIFGDRSRAMLGLPKNQSELNLQKWINAINDHIYFSTNFIKQGTHMGDDSDDEEEAAKQLLSPMAIQDMIVTANAHQKILERHINALQQLLNDETLFFSPERNRDDQFSNDSFHSVQSIDSISRSTIPSIKFHLNLILESSKNANSSLTQCLVLISHQNQSRQTLIQQEQEKVRALEEALQLLAHEHHDLERSVTRSILNSTARQQHSISTSMPTDVAQNNSIIADQSIHNSNLISLNQSLVRSFACLSQTSMATDMDEFYDAFDDAFDDEDDHHQHSNSNPQHPDQIVHCDSSSTNNNNKNSDDRIIIMDSIDNKNEPLNQLKTLTTFHTANDNSEQLNDLTINDSISTLSPDDDDGDADKTIASDDLPLNSMRWA